MTFALPEIEARASTMTEQSETHDNAWLDALRAGNSVALSRFYAAHRDEVSRLVFRVMGPDGEQEDLVQEVFYHAIRGLERYRGDRHGLRPWLRQITIKRCRKKIRYRRVRWWLSFGAREDLPTLTSEATAHQEVLLARAWSIIEQMSTDERIVFTLRFIERCSIPEIVEITAMSRSTVKRRLEGARHTFSTKAREDLLLSEWIEEQAP